MKKSSKIPAPTIYKTIFQAKYKPHLDFFRLSIPAAQSFPDYADWETTGLEVHLMNFEKRCSLSITHNAMGYEQDSKDTSLESSNVTELLNLLPTALDILSFTRLGYRRLYLVDVASIGMNFESLVTVMDLKLLNQGVKQLEIMPVQTKDLMYRVDATEEDLEFHITLGPVRKDEIPRHVVFNQNRHLPALGRNDKMKEIQEHYPETAIFMDFDCYKVDDMECEEGKPFFDKAKLRVHKFAEEFCDYLINTKRGS